MSAACNIGPKGKSHDKPKAGLRDRRRSVGLAIQAQPAVAGNIKRTAASNLCHLPSPRTHFPRRPVVHSLPSQNAPEASLESWRGLPKQNLRFSPRCLTDLASIECDFATMRTLAVIFVLALIAIAGGICSDAVLTSGTAPHADPDPVALAVAHAVKSRPERRP